MVREVVTKKPFVSAVLILQFIPFALFPANIYKPTSQDWWLPVLLLVMVAVADIEIFIQKRDVDWPWNLMSFAQGLNIISRAMMLFPRATINSNGNQIFNGPFVAYSLISMLLSALMLWFLEQPEVRMTMLRD